MGAGSPTRRMRSWVRMCRRRQGNVEPSERSGEVAQEDAQPGAQQLRAIRGTSRG